METFLISLLASVLSSLIFTIILWWKDFSKLKKRIEFIISYLDLFEDIDLRNYHKSILLNDINNINDIYSYSFNLIKIFEGEYSDQIVNNLFNSLIKKHWIIKRLYISYKRRKYQIKYEQRRNNTKI